MDPLHTWHIEENLSLRRIYVFLNFKVFIYNWCRKFDWILTGLFAGDQPCRFGRWHIILVFCRFWHAVLGDPQMDPLRTWHSQEKLRLRRKFPSMHKKRVIQKMDYQSMLRRRTSREGGGGDHRSLTVIVCEDGCVSMPNSRVQTQCVHQHDNLKVN